MAISDYAHWNEEAEQVWWLEEGRFAEEPPDLPDDDYYDDHPRDWEE